MLSNFPGITNHTVKSPIAGDEFDPVIFDMLELKMICVFRTWAAKAEQVWAAEWAALPKTPTSLPSTSIGRRSATRLEEREEPPEGNQVDPRGQIYGSQGFQGNGKLLTPRPNELVIS